MKRSARAAFLDNRVMQPLAALIAVTAVWGVTFVQAEAPLAVPTMEGVRALPACPSWD